MGTTADKLAYLQGAKEAIREAIESLGGTVPDGLPFRQYASRIRNPRYKFPGRARGGRAGHLPDQSDGPDSGGGPICLSSE